MFFSCWDSHVRFSAAPLFPLKNVDLDVCTASVSALENADIGLCSSKPCFGNSSCLEVGDDFICICAAGFTGKHCQLQNTPCSPDSSSCQNGGTCVDSNGSDNSSCICPSGFIGRFCEINVCDPNPCKNDGICSRDNLTFTCICPPGFTGSSCELHINKLKVKPRFKAAVPGHTFHKLHRPADRDLLATQSQVICFAILGLLTCLVVLVTTGIIFLNRCETWMANVKYSQLVQQQRDFLLRAGDGEDHTINVILPEKIKLSNYTSI